MLILVYTYLDNWNFAGQFYSILHTHCYYISIFFLLSDSAKCILQATLILTLFFVAFESVLFNGNWRHIWENSHYNEQLGIMINLSLVRAIAAKWRVANFNHIRNINSTVSNGGSSEAQKALHFAGYSWNRNEWWKWSMVILIFTNKVQ